MSGRMILALLVSPILAGITYGAWLASSLSGIPGAYRSGLWSQFIPGIVAAAVFELFFLLPLLYLLQRLHLRARLWLIGLGMLAWSLLSLAALSLGGSDWSTCVANSPMFLVPGAALVVAFATLGQQGGKA